MPRYRITIEYDGTDFVGWQRQDNGLGVQQVIEEAITRFSGESPNLFAAGRTDAGVHALGQIGHFDLNRSFRTDTVRDALNFHLKPYRVVILKAELVSDDFHARFDALQRGYLYRILNRRPRAALEHNRVWWVPVPLDVEAMHDAAQVLVGNHDFTTFRSSICQAKSPVKTIDSLSVTKNDDIIEIRVRALSFLHHQIRNFAGSLKFVGDGRWTRDDLKAALEAKDRQAGGEKAPAEGLYFTDVIYPDD